MVELVVGYLGTAVCLSDATCQLDITDVTRVETEKVRSDPRRTR